MSNQQTIDDLKQAIKVLEEQDSSLVTRQNATSESIIEITQQIEQISREAARLPFNSPERIALNQQARDLDDRRRVLRAQNNQLSQQINDIDAQIQRFERQIGTLESGGTINQPTPVQAQDPEVAQLLNAELTPEQITQNNLVNAFGPAENIQPVPLQPQQFEQIANEQAFSDGSNIPPPPVTQRQIEQRSQEEAFLPSEQQTVRYSTPPPADTYAQPVPTNPPILFNEGAEGIDAIGGEGAFAARPIPNSQNPSNSVNFETPPDWRVRLSLASAADYLYMAQNPGILTPLKATKGVIFPYVPQINVSYLASYDQQQITHSNYKFYTYQGSAVENITITGDFTAQNVEEANYVLAVIHFFRSATKMFYGQDASPQAGVPPPLLYLTGHGAYQFDNHPTVISSFAYNLPTDVDYINAYPDGADVGATGNEMNSQNINKGNYSSISTSREERLHSAGMKPGGYPLDPQFPRNKSMIGQLTRVPTKISLSITLLPVMTRYTVSNKFSLRDYATGALLRGSKNTGYGGGMW